jgi:small subunit ribosomal protein S14
MIFDRDLYAHRRVRQTNLVRVEALRAEAVTKYQLRRQVLRFIIKDCHVPIACRLLAAQRLRMLTGWVTYTRLSRRCRISGRPRQVLRFAGLARMHLRQQFHEQLLPSLAQKRW